MSYHFPRFCFACLRSFLLPVLGLLPWVVYLAPPPRDFITKVFSKNASSLLRAYENIILFIDLRAEHPPEALPL